MTKYVSDTAAGKAVSAWIVLNRKGEYRGKILAHFSNGGRCLVNVHCPVAGFQHASASGYGYDKFSAALSGLTIDGHKLTDHCGEGQPVPRKGFFPASYKPPRGWKLANYGTWERLDSGKYVRRHSYDWQDMARAGLPADSSWDDVAAESIRLQRAAADAGRLESGHSHCYREAGLSYLEALGYRVIQAI